MTMDEILALAVCAMAILPLLYVSIKAYLEIPEYEKRRRKKRMQQSRRTQAKRKQPVKKKQRRSKYA